MKNHGKGLIFFLLVISASLCNAGSFKSFNPTDNVERQEKDIPKVHEKTSFSLIEKILDLPDDEIDVAYGNLIIGSIYDPTIDVKSYTRQLEDIASDINQRIKRVGNPKKKIARINKYLFHHYGLTAIQKPYPEDFLLHELLKEKRGRCMSLIAMYLGIGFRLHLPVYSVCLPEHVFVRWVSKEKKRTFFSRIPEIINIETTLRGIELSNNHYQSVREGNWIENNHHDFYMRSLTNRETLGLYLSPLGSELREQKRIDEAIYACKLATSINPYDAEAWNNLGMTYRRKNYREMASLAYKKALDVYPGFAEVWQNLGIIQRDVEKRIEYLRKAIAIDQSLASAWRDLVLAYCENKNYDLALTCMTRYQDLGYYVRPDIIEMLKNRVEGHTDTGSFSLPSLSP